MTDGVRQFSGAAVAGVVSVATYAAVLAWAWEYKTFDVWGAVLVVPVVVALNIPLLAAAVRREAEPWFGRIIVAGFALKTVGSLARYWVAFGVYGGVADAARYHNFAEEWSALWRGGVFALPDQASFVGTAFLELVTTAVYTVTGPSIITGFVVFSCLSFWGMYLAYRAFRIALPEGDHRRYALLIFFLPSLLFWPSSIGKEAWLMLCIGAIALGAARLYTRRPLAYPVLLSGLLGAVMVRPHVAALAIAGLMTGMIFRPGGGPSMGLVSKIGGLIAIGVGAAVIAQRAAAFLGVDDLTSESVTEAITWSGGQTEQGGSEFTPVPLTSPLGAPASFVTVLFRPFPWEAHNLQALMASMEGLVLLILVAASWRRLRALPRLFRTRPYLVFATTYIVLFVYAFSSFGNFGILARQRVLVLPFVLVFVALPLVRGASGRPVPARHPGDLSVGQP